MYPNATIEEIQKAEYATSFFLKENPGAMPVKHCIAADLAKQKWRKNRPATVQFWGDLEQAAVSAVREPGTRFSAGPVTFAIPNGCPSYLMCKLPSGRAIAYPRPRIEKGRFGNPALHYTGLDSVTKQWRKQQTYGGKLSENVTQAVARDILAGAMIAVEDNGYPVVLSVHDELIAEVPTDRGSLDDMSEIMCVLPGWADGLPLNAEGFEDTRYRKD